MKAKGYGFSDSQLRKANNLKVTIGAAELVSRTIPKRSGSETPIREMNMSK